ncbi:hypothetical protein FGO68_gene2336 [Halteria grandinella]|uniref:Uncharacterized protein n=1 Tax=Halteria grandinella TaxID=5974 RepID=A0A8J8P4A3_HALGN|nr:hypothetical protein FGO68_gene2336 [Halteria grandinella]
MCSQWMLDIVEHTMIGGPHKSEGEWVEKDQETKGQCIEGRDKLSAESESQTVVVDQAGKAQGLVELLEEQRNAIGEARELQSIQAFLQPVYVAPWIISIRFTPKQSNYETQNCDDYPCPYEYLESEQLRCRQVNEIKRCQSKILKSLAH